jgi:hypothetical protein
LHSTSIPWNQMWKSCLVSSQAVTPTWSGLHAHDMLQCHQLARRPKIDAHLLSRYYWLTSTKVRLAANTSGRTLPQRNQPQISDVTGFSNRFHCNCATVNGWSQPCFDGKPCSVLQPQGRDRSSVNLKLESIWTDPKTIRFAFLGMVFVEFTLSISNFLPNSKIGPRLHLGSTRMSTNTS